MGFHMLEPGHGRYDRVTKGGRHLWYDLTVIQQPERARACGSGPKSSADRRPVDPPPVVELHVYEGEDWNQKTDITFNYNANFFLYTTLGHARALAHGRVQTPAATTPPILSGMPVSGMAYLDRPCEAGYFLFPDLSVRHEGRYRLDFALYEQMKDDADDDAVPPPADSIYSPCGNFSYRMTINSVDFSVFSAKKFPGLTESTTLSRTVAEQGCRVRIRRDVRMRRRGEGKAGGDYDNAEEDFTRRRRTQTPESARARSISNHSVERTPYGPDVQRRPSGAEYPPPPHSAGPASSGYLQFGNQRDVQFPQYPTQQPPPPPPQQQQSSSVPPSPSYPNGSYPSVSSYPPPLPAQPYSSYGERPSSQGYRPVPRDVSGPEYRRPSEPEFRRMSMDTVAPPPPPSAYMPDDRSRPTLPGLATMQIPPASRPHSDSMSSVGRPFSLPSQLPSPPKAPSQFKPMAVKDLLEESTIFNAPPPLILDLNHGEARGQKRQRDEADPGRLVNGARQPEEHMSFTREGKMYFKRANGVMGEVMSLEER